jgi:hypothetical protein
MSRYSKILCVISSAALLAGCQDKNDYQYLVAHPDYLKKRMVACDTVNKTGTNIQKQQCQIVMNAGTQFMATVAQQQTDPEQFGIRILKAESDYMQLKTNAALLTKQLDALHKNNGPAADIHATEAKLELANKACRDKQLEIRLLMAVVGVSTPN